MTAEAQFRPHAELPLDRLHKRDREIWQSYAPTMAPVLARMVQIMRQDILLRAENAPDAEALRLLGEARGLYNLAHILTTSE